jgi:phage tail sheath protein FI
VLRGDRPDQAFQVRCDATVNPPESMAEGRLIAEVSVAIAAPAEYLVVRIGRIDGAIQVLED